MIYAIGDLHGCLAKLKHLLEREGITQNHIWAAGSNDLVLLGDYTDRGEDGIGVIEYIMQLELQAQEVGGRVTALLGNHDVLLLEAYFFPNDKVPGLVKYNKDMTFKEMWLQNGGGLIYDLERLESKHITWLQNRPAMLLKQEMLFMHSDSLFYLEYGNNVTEINLSIDQTLKHCQMTQLDLLEERFCSRKAFLHDPQLAKSFAEQLGAKLILHGHTPIRSMLQLEPSQIFEPLVYADGICVNLDHGLCYGGDGFVWRSA